jgi:hypothetical protein
MYTEHREEILGRLGNVNPARDRRSAKVHIVFLEDGSIGEIGTLMPPIVKLPCAIVWRNELMENCQPVGLVKRKGAEQQCVHYAENSSGRANADSKGGNRESCGPWMVGPEPNSVFEVVEHFSPSLEARAFYARSGMEEIGYLTHG